MRFASIDDAFKLRVGQQTAIVEPEGVELSYETVEWTPPEGVRLTDALYEGYGLQSIRISGSQAHPTKLVQSAAMASVAPPTPSYRDLFWDRLRAEFGNRIALNGHPDHRLPNTLNVSFAGQVGAEILARMPDIAASTGSACHSGRLTLSPVLEAMGITPEVGMGAIRFSLGRNTTEDEIREVVEQLYREVA